MEGVQGGNEMGDAEMGIAATCLLYEYEILEK